MPIPISEPGSNGWFKMIDDWCVTWIDDAREPESVWVDAPREPDVTSLQGKVR